MKGEIKRASSPRTAKQKGDFDGIMFPSTSGSGSIGRIRSIRAPCDCPQAKDLERRIRITGQINPQSHVYLKSLVAPVDGDIAVRAMTRWVVGVSGGSILSIRVWLFRIDWRQCIEGALEIKAGLSPGLKLAFRRVELARKKVIC